MVQAYKIEKVNKLKERLEAAKSIVVVDYKGLNAEETQELRRRMHKEEVDFFVEKNTLIINALNDLGIEGLDEFLVGPTALAVSTKDEVSPAKAITGFIKDIMEDADYPTIKAGYVNGSIMDLAQIKELAKLPSREQLIATVLSGFNAPITGFVGALGAIIRKFVYVVDAIAKKEAENN